MASLCLLKHSVFCTYLLIGQSLPLLNVVIPFIQLNPIPTDP